MGSGISSSSLDLRNKPKPNNAILIERIQPSKIGLVKQVDGIIVKKAAVHKIVSFAKLVAIKSDPSKNK
jgi:hypothetical protein